MVQLPGGGASKVVADLMRAADTQHTFLAWIAWRAELAQAVDDGDHWTVTCPRDQALNRGGVDVHLDKGLEAGDVVLTAADGSCSDTFRMTSITVE